MYINVPETNRREEHKILNGLNNATTRRLLDMAAAGYLFMGFVTKPDGKVILTFREVN